MGLAWADQQRKKDTRVVAVVGDASIVNGLSLEAVNNLTRLDRQLLIVLNDNSMAIDRTQGGMADLLGTSVRQRAMALISIAHPEFRQELLAAIRTVAAGERYLPLQVADRLRFRHPLRRGRCGLQ